MGMPKENKMNDKLKNSETKKLQKSLNTGKLRASVGVNGRHEKFTFIDFMGGLGLARQ